MPKFNRLSQRGSSPLGLVFFVAAFILGLVLLISSLSVIDQGEGGVEKRFGRVTGVVLEPGTHFINPFSSVVKRNVQLRNYTMSTVAQEGQKAGDDSIAVMTSDSMTVRLDCSVLYNLSMGKLPYIVSNIAGNIDEEVMRPQIREALRFAAADYISNDLYTTKRSEFIAKVEARLRGATQSYGINVQQVLIRDVKLPDSVVRTINEKKQAEQESEKMTYVLSKAQKEAEVKRVEAQGQADAARIVSQTATPVFLELERIKAMKEIALHANYALIPANSNMLMQAPNITAKQK